MRPDFFCKVGMKLSGVVDGRPITGTVEQLAFRLNDHNGLVPSALLRNVTTLVISDGKFTEQALPDMWVTVDDFGPIDEDDRQELPNLGALESHSGQQDDGRGGA